MAIGRGEATESRNFDSRKTAVCSKKQKKGTLAKNNTCWHIKKRSENINFDSLAPTVAPPKGRAQFSY